MQLNLQCDWNHTFLSNQLQGVTNNYGSSKYWAHETGVNELNANGTSSAITSYIRIR
jgi:hypothetical protein